VGVRPRTAFPSIKASDKKRKPLLGRRGCVEESTR